MGQVVNPFPLPGRPRARIWTDRTPSCRREPPRGRTDPPDRSPGPWKHKEGGPQRTSRTIRPWSAVAARWRQPASHSLSGTWSRRTMAPVCRLRLPRWLRRPFIWSNTCRECFRMVPMPSWLKRAQHLGVASTRRRPTRGGPRDGEVARDQDLCIRTSAGIILNALMVEELSKSKRDERLLACQVPDARARKVLLAGSRGEEKRRRHTKPRLWQHRTDPPST